MIIIIVTIISVSNVNLFVNGIVFIEYYEQK